MPAGVEDREINIWSELLGKWRKLGVNMSWGTAQFVWGEGWKERRWGKWVPPTLPGKLGMSQAGTFSSACCAFSETQLRRFGTYKA